MSKTAICAMMAGLLVLAVNQSAPRAQQAYVPKPPRYNPPVDTRILPPVEYDKLYTGKLTVEEVPDIETLLKRCELPQKWALGCAFAHADSCTVILVPEHVIKKYNWTRELMMRHELGHCNGWPGDHPGIRRWPLPRPAGATR